MKVLYILLLLMMITSCKDQEKQRNDRDSGTVNARQKDTAGSADLPPGNIQRERDAVQTKRDTIPTRQDRETHSFEGRYTKTETKDTSGSCTCNCIEVSFATPTQLCIDPDGLTILARIEETSNTTAEIYLTGPEEETSEQDLPWDDFDRDIPIAILDLQQDGTLELDWIGFSTDGELAVDYAIYGKKTLEGTYERDR